MVIANRQKVVGRSASFQTGLQSHREDETAPTPEAFLFMKMVLVAELLFITWLRILFVFTH